jgi:alpha-beta hydrolase superfamily lysophospholipase
LTTPPFPAPRLETLHASDGVPLVLSRWPTRDPRGLALLVHGLGEHAGRYGEVAARLGRAGWEVAGYDHRGHGHSGGPRGVIPTGTALLEDLGEVIRHLAPEGDPRPFLLLGHSMGGVIAARFVAEARGRVDRLVLTSPALDAGLRTGRRLLVRVARRLAPDLAISNGLDPSGISTDPAVVQAYLEDPLVHDRISPRLAGFVMESGPRVLAAAPRWKVPTLVLWAGDDRFVGPEGSARFVAAAPEDLVTGHPFPALRHEILNEPEREEVFRVLLGWLEVEAARESPLG